MRGGHDWAAEGASYGTRVEVTNGKVEEVNSRWVLPVIPYCIL